MHPQSVHFSGAVFPNNYVQIEAGKQKVNFHWIDKL